MSSRADRARFRHAAEALLIEATGATRIVRLCPRCGSGEHGRPMAVGARVSVSIAYAADLAVVAWSPDGLVGVDLEPAGPPLPGIGSRDAWTRAEAVLKASGEGVHGDPARTEAWVRRLDLPADHVGHVALIGGVGGVGEPRVTVATTASTRRERGVGLRGVAERGAAGRLTSSQLLSYGP